MRTVNGKKVVIVPCSGIGKAQGLIARESVYQAIEQLGEDVAGTLCLGLVVTGDEENVDAIRSHPCITVDGCPKMCSLKNLEMAQARIAQSLRVVDAMREFKGAQPGSATALTEDGWAIAAAISRGLVDDVHKIIAEGAEG